jgi:hypothetical protein
MRLMKTGRRVARLTVVLTLAWVTMAWVTGCSRQVTVPGAGATADSGHLPFDRVSDESGVSPTAGFTPEGIPAGTEVTIRLQFPLSSADSRVGDSFQATLDEPIVVAGKTLVARGAAVTGSVVAAKACAGGHDPGYLRVTLAAVAMDGKSIPVQTSSIFAKGRWYEKRKVAAVKRSEDDATAGPAGTGTARSLSPGQGDVRFSTGHRLTFRLAQPLHL